MRFDLRGRVALVTGAGRGIGLGIARALCEHGATALINDLLVDRAHEAEAEPTVAGAVDKTVAFDVTDHEAAGEAIVTAGSDHGPIDVLVNNAGVPEGMSVAPFRESAPERSQLAARSWRGHA